MQGQKVKTMNASRLHIAIVLRRRSKISGPNGPISVLQFLNDADPPVDCSNSFRLGRVVVV